MNILIHMYTCITLICFRYIYICNKMYHNFYFCISTVFLSLIINNQVFANILSNYCFTNINKPSSNSIVIASEIEKELNNCNNNFNRKYLNRLKLYRGGSTILSTVMNNNSIVMNNNDQKKWSLRGNLWKNILGLWGVMQVVSILSNAIKRLYPIAIQPILMKDITTSQWIMYITWSIYMMYTEGYKAFQLKFSPLVVQRAFSLDQNPSIINYLLAGPYSMGLFGASRKRMIISWCITAGVFSLVKIVKMLPYPYRSIIDAGVVCGLSYGTISICVLTIKALLGGKIDSVVNDEVVTNNNKNKNK